MIPARPFDPLSHLDHNAARRPDAPAVFDADRTISFAELRAAVYSLIAGLGPLSPTEPVAVHLPNIWEYVALEIAIPAAGGVIMPLPLALGKAELDWAMSRAGASRMITSADLPSLPFGTAPPPVAGTSRMIISPDFRSRPIGPAPVGPPRPRLLLQWLCRPIRLASSRSH